jgi:hypothetical protein
MRQNDDRLSKPEAPKVPQSNVGLMNYVVPTEVVDLPSKGIFYPKDHPLHNQEFVEIKHMTAKEEDILTSTSLITKGVVLDHLIQSLLLDKNINARTLFTGDRNAILVNARMNAYGSDYKASSICSECSTFTETTFDLSTMKSKEDSLDEESLRFILPKTEFPVTIRFLTVHEEGLLEKEVEKKTKMGFPDSSLTTFLKFIVTSVDGVNASDGFISQFLENMPTVDAKFIKKQYVDSKPDVDFSQEVECKSCSHTERREMPISADFFWPQS